MEGALPEPREAELIARLRSKDLDALGELYRDLGGVMLTLARSMMRDKDEADDVVEDALMRIHQAAPGFRGERGLRTWTLRIVANLCRDRLRRGRFSAGDPEAMDPLAHAGLVVNPTAGWDRDLDLERRLAELEKALAQLPAEQREAVILRDRLELSYEDCAEAAGISVAALKSRLFRARENLRSRLGDQRSS
ncbi:MAG TPA: RNA polymerase sigma factor [Candidatus Eisenbacteria bacterium]|jgi:RNA polymerase sigma-70 factor (ECF subfamily)|nr:RNA polymerase sigma factor [Candidatus Eisenbacteria bacterium]